MDYFSTVFRDGRWLEAGLLLNLVQVLPVSIIHRPSIIEGFRKRCCHLLEKKIMSKEHSHLFEFFGVHLVVPLLPFRCRQMPRGGLPQSLNDAYYQMYGTSASTHARGPDIVFPYPQTLVLGTGTV